MPKLQYKGKKKDDDEIVAFEAFCNDRPSKSSIKKDSLTLNDNINYQLYYDKDNVGESSQLESNDDSNGRELKETSLTDLGPKNVTIKHKNTDSGNFRKGWFYPQNNRYAFLNRMKHGTSNSSNAASSNEEGGTKYERFSDTKFFGFNICRKLPGIGSSVLLLTVVCILCGVVWWGVWGVVGGAWGEEHYRRLWERAHPHHNQNPHTHYSPSVIVHQQLERLDPIPPFEPKYHDHNNLSTKNRNASEMIKMKNRLESLDNDSKKLPPPFGSASSMPMLDKSQCTVMKDELRFDCYPQSGASEKGCIERGCCWQPLNQNEKILDEFGGDNVNASIGIPYCFYPPTYGNYHVTNITETRHGMLAYLERQFQSSYPDDINAVAINIRYMSDSTLQIKIYDAEKSRFEPPYPEIPSVSEPLKNLKYRVVLETSKLGFKIIRISDGTEILNSQDIGGFIFSNKFLQISFLLPSDNIYGLGENQGPFLLSTNWNRFTIFNNDMPPRENINLYGSHPFYLVMENSGKSHGVLLLNSNAMDVVLQPTPAITFRPIGGIFNFFVMLGPEPSNVISQYTGIIGRPFIPPYWSLGFHLCKYGYGSLEKTKEVWKRTKDAGIPFDVQWNDIDYMDNRNDFTVDKVKFKDLPAFIKEVHNSGMHYVMILDPGVSGSEDPGTYPPYDEGIRMNVFIKDKNGKPFAGKVWNRVSTVWPDFTHPNATAYWVNMFRSLHKTIPFDGAWIDMNEPSNIITGPLNGQCDKEDLPYTPTYTAGPGLCTKTICMNAQQHAGLHFDVHNLYSISQATATYFALSEIRGKRPFIISRSSFPGIGKFSGHWSGDIQSEWYDMKMTIPQILSFSLFGVPMMGADICGFGGNTTVNLCRRWMELGAFYPFSRNHNDIQAIDQDPVALGPEVVNASREALKARYTLLPYLYTLFWKAHSNGDTVARPVFFEFPKDNWTYALDQQFMWGSSIMIVPILDEFVTSVKGYIPKSVWYKYHGLQLLDRSGWITLNENETLLIRGGSILPMHILHNQHLEPITTTILRSEPLQLIVAFDEVKSARGSLYWDDGDSLNTYEERKYSLINFAAYNDTLKGDVDWWGYGVPSVDAIVITGQTTPVTAVYLNKKTINHFEYDSVNHILAVRKINLPLNNGFMLRWK